MFNVITYTIYGLCCMSLAIMEFKNSSILVLSLSCAALTFRVVSQEIDKLKK